MKKLFKSRKTIFPLLLLGFLVFSFGVFAAQKPLEQSYPTALGKQLTNQSTLPDLIAYLYNFAIMIAGIAVFFMLVIGGFKYLTSAGDPGKAKEAKDQLTSSVFGLILLLSSFLILNTINPQLTTLTPPWIGSQTPCDAKTDKTQSECPAGEKCIGDIKPDDNKKDGKCFPASPGIKEVAGLEQIKDGVLLFEKSQFEGGAYILKTENPVNNFNSVKFNSQDNEEGAVMNNKISSAMVGSNVYAILCEHADYIDCGYFGTTVDNLHEIGLKEGNWGDSISSARVGINPDESPCEGVILYDLADRALSDGKDSEFYSFDPSSDTHCVNNIGEPTGNDAVTSLSISGNCKVTLYRDDECQGESISFSHTYKYGQDKGTCGENAYCCEQDYNCVKDLIKYSCPTCKNGNWHDDASSVKIEALP